jgi:hypothetical protein
MRARRLLALVLAAMAGGWPALAGAKHRHADMPVDGLADTTVLIIRHAEKPDDGAGLAPAGEARARAYVDYFKHLSLDGRSATPDTLMATADSKHSLRPGLTIRPLSQALGLPVDQRFGDEQTGALVDALRAGNRGRVLLICWHHGEIPALIEGFGGDAGALLPQGRWPSEVYGWLVVLHFDHAGRLLPDAGVVHENLMPDDMPARRAGHGP